MELQPCLCIVRVRPMASKAVIRKDRADVAVKAQRHLIRRQCGGSEQRQENSFQVFHRLVS